jgi:hypothetical protein
MTRPSLEEYRKLLGPGYDPHGGFAAMRREAEFYEWAAAGNDGTKFAAMIAAREGNDQK